MRFIVPLIMLAVSVGLFFTYTQKTWISIQELRTKQTEYNDALTNANELEQVRNDLLAKYNAFDPSSIEKLKKLLPDNVDNIKLILEINEVAFKYGMLLKNVKFDATDQNSNSSSVQERNSSIAQKNKSYGTFDVEFSSEGTYSNFVSFMSDLEKSLRIVDVNAITFSSPELPQTLGGVSPSKPKDSYKYDFKISTYWLKN
jgi:Tfp pilus assembly protein PilO